MLVSLQPSGKKKKKIPLQSFFSFKSGGREGLRSSSASRCATLWKGYALTSAPHCPCSACLRFNRIQIFITIWIKPLIFFVHSARELHWWYWGGGGQDDMVSSCRQAIRKGMRRNVDWLFYFFPFFFYSFLFFFLGDGLKKIAIKVLDTDLYLFISFLTYPHIQNPLSVSTRSLWILACRRGEKKKKKKIKIHQLMCRLVMK